MDRLRSGLALAATLAFGVVMLPATSFAQGPALSLVPQDQPRTQSLWSIFSTNVAPSPAPEAKPAETEQDSAETETPEPATPAKYRLVKVPLPPIPDRRAATAKAKDSSAKDSSAKGNPKAQAAAQPVDEAPSVAVPAPPQPRPTGVFAMFAAYSQPEGEGASTMSDGDIVRPALTPLPTTKVAPPAQPAPPTSTKITRLDLTDPFRPRRMGTPGEKDDDLEDEEGATKLVEKQVDSVQISCLKPDLMALIYKAGDHFGDTPVITSGFRGHGRRGSYHRKCEAADFFIPGVSGGKLVSYLKTLPGAGGVGTYCHTRSVHIDTGEPRNWHQCGRRRSFALREPVLEIGSR